MYDADRDAVARWWQAIAAALRAQGLDRVPDTVDWPTDLDAHWTDPHLLLSQTCGYPLVTRLRDRVQVVGAFAYSAPGCSGIRYRSELVVRAGDATSIEAYRGRVAAINSTDSHSGCNALRRHVQPLAVDSVFFGGWKESGSHRRSLALVQDGDADLAAIDCVTLAGLRRREPHLFDGLQLVGSTAAAPGLPLITALRTTAADMQAIRRALTDVCADPAWREVREALFIRGFEAVPAPAWEEILAAPMR